MNQSTVSRGARPLWGVLLLSLSAAAAALVDASGPRLLPPPGELLEYRISYRGILSGFVPVEIADASLRIAAEAERIGARDTLPASLEISTERFAAAEAFYPMRFNYTSWMLPVGQQALVVSKRKRTSDLAQEVVWLDSDEATVRRFENKQRGDGDRDPAGGRLPDEILRHVGPDDEALLTETASRRVDGDGVPLDRLSMLYRVRSEALEVGRVFEWPVTDGKDLVGYRIEVLAQGRVEIGGERRPAFKLRFDARYDSGKEVDPVYAWIGTDAQRLPLRFYGKRALGVFDVSLVTGVRPAPEPEPPKNGFIDI